MEVGKQLAEYHKNETEEQKKERFAKASETRKKNTKEKRHIEYATQKAMKLTWKVPFYEDVKQEDGSFKKELVEVKYMKTPEMIVARLIKEASAEESKNVVGAVKEIRAILGETKEETTGNNLTVIFGNKDIEI